MEISTVLCYGLAAICFILLPLVLLNVIKDRKKMNIAATVIFCCYLLVLFVGVFGKVEVGSSTTKISLDFSGQWCTKSIKWNFSHLSTFDIVVNLVMLIPVGIFVAYFAHRKWKIWGLLIFLVFIGIASGCFIEIFQFILPVPRSVQLSDIVFNTISVFVGGLVGLGMIALASPKQNYVEKK